MAVADILQAPLPRRLPMHGPPFQSGSDLADELARALADPAPARLEDGGAIRTGFDGELDAHRTLRDESRQVIATLQLDFAQRFGVASLKIKHHAQLGYIIEAPSVAVEKLRGFPELTLRQGHGERRAVHHARTVRTGSAYPGSGGTGDSARTRWFSPIWFAGCWRKPTNWRPVPRRWRFWMRRNRPRNWRRAARGCGRR